MHVTRFRKNLSKPGMIEAAHNCFSHIKDRVVGRQFELPDYLMAVMAVFSVKSRSLLDFEDSYDDSKAVRQNLKNLFHLKRIPRDSSIRKRLDTLNPTNLRKTYTTIFSFLQRGKVLAKYKFLGKYILVSIDGTEYYSSRNIKCAHCCERTLSDGSTLWFHQILTAVICHPDHDQVFPLFPEPIMKEDGDTKNDCELVASRRLIMHIRREHPHLPMVVIEDGLYSNGPNIMHLIEHNMKFIIVAKVDDHKALFDALNTDSNVKIKYYWDKEKGIRHEFRYLLNTPINASHPDVRVNVVEYSEYITVQKKNEDGSIEYVDERKYHNVWVTDLDVNDNTLLDIMRAGRSRWKIENETFNTLKNQGYHLEHNYGHGHKFLSVIFTCLTMLVFLIDQIELFCCPLVQSALENCKRLCKLWKKARNLFEEYYIDDWQTFYLVLIHGNRHARASPDV